MKKDLELKLFFVIKNYVRFHSISKLDQLERMNDNRESQRVQAREKSNVTITASFRWNNTLYGSLFSSLG